MTFMDTLLLAIIGHLVGDYLAQNDWMALNKKLRTWPCFVHCCLWSLAVVAFAGWWTWWVWPLLVVLHFIQDRSGIILWWMTKVNSQQKFATGVCAPWSVIVVDNVWHIVSLVAVAKMLTKLQS